MRHFLRQDASGIFRAVLKAVDPHAIVEGQMDKIRQIYRDGNFERLLMISFGKAAFPMALALADGTGDLLVQGILITKDGHLRRDRLPDRIIQCEAGHPVPDIRGVRATQRVVAALQEAARETLVVFLISGGGSALLVSPVEGITLEEKQEITRLLLMAGADIGELNTVRKHISLVKGGRLAERAYPARAISLILSDVIGDRLDVIASGPTAPDQTTFADALEVIGRYRIKDRIPSRALEILLSGARGEIPETPKEKAGVFSTVENCIVGSNRMALAAAKSEAAARGYEVTVLSDALQGEARETGHRLARQAIETAGTVGGDGKGPRCLLAGGETTVRVTGSGLGGRNTELALAFAQRIKGMGGITLLSAGTDGTDGPTDAAGAIVDGRTIERAESPGMDPEEYLKNNDSYNFLKATDDLFITGPTGTNVMDLQIILIDSEP